MNERSTTRLRVYTDEEAVREGLLIPVGPVAGVNRVSRDVYEALAVRGARDAGSAQEALLEAIHAASGAPRDTGWHSGTYRGRTLWLLPNETGGLTLTFPPQPTALR